MSLEFRYFPHPPEDSSNDMDEFVCNGLVSYLIEDVIQKAGQGILDSTAEVGWIEIGGSKGYIL